MRRRSAKLLFSLLCSLFFGSILNQGFAQTQLDNNTPDFEVTAPQLDNTDNTTPLEFPMAPRFATMPTSGVDLSKISSDVEAASTIPFWSGSKSYKGVKYSYTLVGHGPINKAIADPSVTVPAVLIPLKIKFEPQDVTFDPTAKDACSPAGTPFTLAQQSPEFNNHKYVVGGTDVGTTQYADFFQRAEFWVYTKPTGVNPGYHVLLKESNPVIVSFTATNYTVDGGCGPGLGLIDVNAFDSYLQKTIIPLVSKWVGPTVIPIFLTHNVVFYEGTTSDCCIIGYHSAFKSPVQTYSVADYDTSGDFGTAIEDVEPMSHEVSELINDPLVNNATPPWGHIGQVSGCQANFEVGDPLTGTTVKVKMPNGFTYHPQELAFFSWFYRGSPSDGVNGWYSSNGTFKTFQAICQ
jgi:hypothetical protein